jgi:hypothetical protein
VSLFLAEGIQQQSGKLIIASCINDRVGLVRSFAADGSLECEEKLPMASQKVGRRGQIWLHGDTCTCVFHWCIEQFTTSHTRSSTVHPKSLATVDLVLQVNPAEFFCHPVPLGDNLYNKNRPKVVPPARGADSTTDTQQKQAEQQPQEQSAPGASQPDKVSHMQQ